MRYSALSTLFLIILSSCGSAAPLPTPAPTPVQSATVTPTPITPSATPALVGNNDPDTVLWQGLLIRLPEYAVWHEENPTDTLNGVPIRAQGYVTYPMAALNPTVEMASGPRFTIVEFAGTPADWLQRERANATSMAGNTIDESTIRETFIAGQPAIVYQRMVRGTSELTYAIVGLDRDEQERDGQLLITFEAALDSNLAMIAELALAPATAPLPTPAAATTPVEQSAAYQELVQRGQHVLAVAMPSAQTAVIFYAAIGHDKAGQPAPALSPIGVMVLHAQSGSYQRAWQMMSAIESPLAPERMITPWTQRIFDAIDVTGDGQAELVLSGCTGFGNHCSYQATVWSLDGQLLFATQPDRFGGWRLWSDRQTIVTRSGHNIVGQAEAEIHPEQWQIDWYRWDGTTFAHTATKLVPATGDGDGPAMEELETP